MEQFAPAIPLNYHQLHKLILSIQRIHNLFTSNCFFSYKNSSLFSLLFFFLKKHKRFFASEFKLSINLFTDCCKNHFECEFRSQCHFLVSINLFNIVIDWINIQYYVYHFVITLRFPNNTLHYINMIINKDWLFNIHKVHLVEFKFELFRLTNERGFFITLFDFRYYSSFFFSFLVQYGFFLHTK